MTLLATAQDVEDRVNRACASTSIPDLDACQDLVDEVEGAIDEAMNALDRQMDAHKQKIAELKNEYDQLEAKGKQMKRLRERCKRTIIGLRIAEKHAAPPPVPTPSSAPRNFPLPA